VSIWGAGPRGSAAGTWCTAGPRRPGSGKEAAPAGGESGGRAHGPALGGEAGSVLIEKLIRIGLSYRP